MDTTTPPYQLVHGYFVNFRPKMGTPPYNFIVGAGKFHTFYKKICKTWILDISFWIIVPWSLKTVEIVTNTGKNYEKYAHKENFCQPRRKNCLKVSLEILKIAKIGQKFPKFDQLVHVYLANWKITVQVRPVSTVYFVEKKSKKGTTTRLCSLPLSTDHPLH